VSGRYSDKGGLDARQGCARNRMTDMARTPVLPERTCVGSLSAQLKRQRMRSATTASRRHRPLLSFHLRGMWTGHCLTRSDEVARDCVNVCSNSLTVSSLRVEPKSGRSLRGEWPAGPDIRISALTAIYEGKGHAPARERCGPQIPGSALNPPRMVCGAVFVEVLASVTNALQRSC
jgi:hypothetical protein